jgi:serine protease Do
MSQQSTYSLRARRVRNALLASALTVGALGASGAGALFGDSNIAVAQPVEAPAAAPADFTSVVETVKPAVVSVQVKTQVEAVADRVMPNLPEGFDNLPEDHPMNEFFRRFGMPGAPGGDDNGRQPFQPRRGMAQGSGFFISEDGYLVTNAHVVDDASEVMVAMDDGRELKAEVIGADERTDLALLKVEGNGFSYVKFAQDEPKVGQWVLAVGNPFGLGGSVTAGIISAEGRDIGAGPYDNFLQIDAPVNRGNSGGPTFNTRGEVVGVNTAIFSPSGGNVGIAFAIPAKNVQEIVGDLREDGVVTRGWLGVQIQPVTEDIAASLGVPGTDGAIVADAQPESPAAKAGIVAGDIITKVNNAPVKDPKELSATISRMDPDQKVNVTVVRDGREQQIEVTLGNLNELDKAQQAAASPDKGPEKAAPASLDGLGLTVGPNENGEGVVVTGVADESPASETGLTAGDVIVGVGGQPVKSAADIEAGVKAAQDQGRSAVLLKVQGENGARFVGVPFERG